MAEIVWKKPADQIFTYEGRIDFENANAPTFVYAGSYFGFRLSGFVGYLCVQNHHGYFENTLGILVDGVYRGKIVLHDGEKICGETKQFFRLRFRKEDGERLNGELAGKREETLENVRFYDLSAFLDGGEHEITVFKRMDTCHYFTFHGLITENGAAKPSQKGLAARRIEVFGDSVSCGEVSEAIGRCGGDDPEGHNGIYSNSFYSYSWILARMLDARVHITSQGGIALLDGEGYFNEPERVGMLSSFDKIQINPSLGTRKNWDFNQYMPHVVIIAIGQNDHHPDNYMVEDYEGEKAVRWREGYRLFLEKLRAKYPHAELILSTTILGHEKEWDDAIEQVCREFGDAHTHHFLYSNNGCGTTGHIRRPEAEKMAAELKRFIDSLGEGIWED